MRNTITIQLRAFPITIQDKLTREIREDTLVISKDQLQAAQIIGQSSKELITRICARQNCLALNIGTPARRELVLDLTAEYARRWCNGK